MTTIKKIKIAALIAAPVLFVIYLAWNGWHLMPQPFITYGGKGQLLTDSSATAGQYKKFCAGCHGDNMTTFVNNEWKFGKTRSAVFKAIKYGYPNTGMPAFDVTFSDKQTYELSDYLLAGIANAALNKTAQPARKGIFETELLTIKIDTVAAIGEVPWFIAFLPGNEMLVTERGGALYRVTAGREVQKVSGTPAVVAAGQGGLLDVVLHPDFTNNKLIYLSYSKAEPGNTGKSTTAVMQAILEGNTLTQQRDIFTALPYATTRHHYGGRMVFDKKGYLFLSVGERGNEKQNPQTLTNDLGKIHRLNADGTIPADNPFIMDKKAKPSIFCYGNRNPQGLALHPVTGEIWENEHGPMGGDEINLIEGGKNYGWPVITYGINYNGTPITDVTSKAGMEQPLHFWVPSIAPSGLAFVQGDKYKGWEGDVLSGSLKFHWLSRCKVNGHVISSEESMMKEAGRMRDVRMGTDAYIYITVESPGYVLRLMPM